MWAVPRMVDNCALPTMSGTSNFPPQVFAFFENVSSAQILIGITVTFDALLIMIMIMIKTMIMIIITYCWSLFWTSNRTGETLCSLGCTWAAILLCGYHQIRTSNFWTTAANKKNANMLVNRDPQIWLRLRLRVRVRLLVMLATRSSAILAINKRTRRSDLSKQRVCELL